MFFDKGFHLLTAHRLSSFYGQTETVEVGSDYLWIGNFVASCHHYGKLYYARLSTDQSHVDIVRVEQGAGVVVDRFAAEGANGAVNDLFFLHLSRPGHYFAGRNLVYVWMRTLYVRQLHG